MKELVNEGVGSFGMVWKTVVDCVWNDGRDNVRGVMSGGRWEG